MGKFSKQHIIDELVAVPLVPLIAHEDPNDCFHVVKSCYEAGIRVFEYTNRTKNAWEVFEHLHRKREFYPELKLGVGTVLDAQTAKKFISAGADFIVSPILNLQIGDVCHEHSTMWIPGCATLTEIVTAQQNGADVIKVFPGSVLGPAFLQAILPVVPSLRLMVTGGIENTEESFSTWFKAGAMCLGLGSQVLKKDMIAARQWESVKNEINRAVALAQRCRVNKHD